jgi:hypothetical protein
MSKPINVFGVERIKKAAADAYVLRVDKKDFMDWLVEALAVEQGRSLSWRSRGHAVVDARRLLESGNASGRYAILNCSCGSGAGCVDLEDEIEVVHEEDRIIWNYKAPRFEEREARRVFTFAFHKPQYLKELGRIR